jgi:hypothetical protein
MLYWRPGIPSLPGRFISRRFGRSNALALALAIEILGNIPRVSNDLVGNRELESKSRNSSVLGVCAVPSYGAGVL